MEHSSEYAHEDGIDSMLEDANYAAQNRDPDQHLHDDPDTNDALIEEENSEEPIACLELFNGVSQDTINLSIYPGKEFRVGRDDPELCQWIIQDPHVSKQHLRIYSVVYDKSKLAEIPPLVYCEDLESTNGTFVNGQCIGRVSGEMRGYLLSDGDVVEIKPHWRFMFHQVHQHGYLNLKCSGDIQYFEDQYAITDRLLGSGQFGQVFLAKDLPNSQQLACKVVDLGRCGETIPGSGETWQDQACRARDEKRRIFQEIKVLSQLSHPHIIDLKKAFCSNNFVYIFTELASAGDMYSYLDSRGGTVDDLEGRVISRQILLALEYMHSNRIAHRDLKPENILIMQTYSFGCRVVLTDFGFANHTDQKSGRFMSRVGTDGYCAPEVENVPKIGYTLAADMWSLGALTFTILVGEKGASRDEFSQHSQQMVLEFVDTAGKGVCITPRARRFIRELLVHNPAKRMTAQQALQHSWLTKPGTEGAAIEAACRRINRSWKERVWDSTVIENLPDRALVNETEQVSSTTKPRKKIPDVTPFPYVGLDRYFQQSKSQFARGSLLNELKEKQALFFAEEPIQSSPELPDHRSMLRVGTAPAHDLFRKVAKRSRAPTIDDANDDDMDLVPLRRRAQPEGISMEEDEDSTYTLAGHKPRSSGSELYDAWSAKRIKTLSQKVADHGAPANQVPRYSKAKEFGDIMRQMEKRKSTASSSAS